MTHKKNNFRFIKTEDKILQAVFALLREKIMIK